MILQWENIEIIYIYIYCYFCYYYSDISDTDDSLKQTEGLETACLAP